MRPIGLMFLLLLVSYSNYAQIDKVKPRINHVAIYVKELKSTKAFYQNIIGLDTIPEPFHDGKHAWFEIGTGISLHVIEGAASKKDYYKNQHTCLSVKSVEAFTEHLAKNNIEWEDGKGNKNSITNRVDGIKQIWIKDPDGYWIEINNDLK